MDLYFGKPSGNLIVLDPDESNHLINVKRSHQGDIIYTTDGEGKIYTTKVHDLNKKGCVLEITETKSVSKNPASLHIAIAPTKNIDRIEWFLEKATEMGIDEITFLLCRHSERKEIKADRLNRVLIASIKQSVKSYLPKINPVKDFKTFISGNFSGTKIICSMNADKNDSLDKYYNPGNDLVALIGPEGDFHSSENTLALENSFIPVTLGSSRLRTETAALFVCTTFNFVNHY